MLICNNWIKLQCANNIITQIYKAFKNIWHRGVWLRLIQVGIAQKEKAEHYLFCFDIFIEEFAYLNEAITS